jgi:hypothetical protein
MFLEDQQDSYLSADVSCSPGSSSAGATSLFLFFMAALWLSLLPRMEGSCANVSRSE